MISGLAVENFANEWIGAWNSHDLDAIMDHYDDSVVLVSPVAARLLNNPSGTVPGAAALRSYFERGLDLYPNLRFELLEVMHGVASLVLVYRNQRGTRTAEFMEFGENGKVIRVVAHYSA